MKALSVRQPYAEAIASGRKTIEVRSWYTKYRGPLLIVASARRSGELPTGGAVCIVDLVDIREGCSSDSGAAMCDPTGEYAWILENPRRVPFKAIRGRLNLYEVEVDDPGGVEPAPPRSQRRVRRVTCSPSCSAPHLG